MKRLASSDSLGGLMSICQPSTGEHNNNNQQGSSQGYSRDFQSMLEGLDEEGCVEESGHMPEKKRRLSNEQVKALEKNFEVDNKLEPERKVKLAQELSLQPRQVAVWFQNRRARWKTKQLERDYGILKANFDSLKQNFEKLQLENKSLLQEIGELKSAIEEDDKDESKVSVKEEIMASESEEKDTTDDHNLLINNNNFKAKAGAASMDFVIAAGEYENDEDATTELNFESFNSNNNNGSLLMGATLFTDFKDGSSDESDSSAILNDNLSPNAAISSSSAGGGVFQSQNAFFNSNGSSSSLAMNVAGFQFPNTKPSILGDAAHMGGYHPQFVKIEEHNFFGGDESCSTFFSDDQPPSLQWDCPEEWN